MVFLIFFPYNSSCTTVLCLQALVARKPGSRAHIARYDFQVIGRPASMFGSSLASLGDIDQDGYRGRVLVTALLALYYLCNISIND